MVRWNHEAPRTGRGHRRIPARGRRDRPRGRRSDRGGGGDEARSRADGRRPHRSDSAQAEPGRRVRLPGLRLAGPGRGPPAHRRVLRERRQGGHRGGDPTAAQPEVLREASRRGAPRAHRLLARPAGPDHRADGAARRRHPLRADRMGRRLRHDRPAPQRAGHARRGDLLHVGEDVERGCVRLPAVRPRLRHEQPARLLEHVPRVDLGRRWPRRSASARARSASTTYTRRS